MKIDLSTIDPESFMVHQHFVGEHPVLLVQPIHIGAKWTKDNLIFRSSVWDMEGNLVSASWKKFANFGEKPDVFDVPVSLDGTSAMEKIDGSTLIVSKYKGHLITRTRGTVDTSKLDNGYEVDFLKDKYPKVFSDTLLDTHSLVFEWTSPTNRVVIDYGSEPLLYLTGIICHANYSYVPSQQVLDDLALEWGVLRPKTYKFDTLSDLQVAVKAFRGVEGICLYFNDGQDITKIKGDEYLFCHRMKSELGSIDKVIDLWFDQGQMSYQEFFDWVSTNIDYEVAVMVRGHISNICDAWKDVEKIISGLNGFVSPLLINKVSRRDAAMAIMQAYGSTGRSAMCFTLLDKKPLSVDQKKKLLYQTLKK